MVHIFVGTKAQFIKMAPLMRILAQRKIPYRFIDAGQHGALSADLVETFGLREPDVRLRASATSITTIPQALWWTLGCFCKLVFRPDSIRRKVFANQDGICLIHGDTLTTLISLLYARRSGLRVGHVEAGLRSFRLLDPFPEEIIRRIVMRFSQYLFTPSDSAYKNILAMGYADKTYPTNGNTGRDAVHFALTQATAASTPASPYAVVTIHRLETLYSRTRLKQIVAWVQEIARERKVLFVLHEPTRAKLAHYKLLAPLEKNPAVELLSLLTYTRFIHLLRAADFVLSDGGSIQEECAQLGTPCLIARQKTEREEGLGENARLLGFQPAALRDALKLLPDLRRPPIEMAEEGSPSAAIVAIIETLL